MVIINETTKNITLRGILSCYSYPFFFFFCLFSSCLRRKNTICLCKRHIVSLETCIVFSLLHSSVHSLMASNRTFEKMKSLETRTGNGRKEERKKKKTGQGESAGK